MRQIPERTEPDAEDISNEELLELEDRVVPRVWVVEEAVGDKTVATYKELSIDEPLPEDMFTLERLKRP